MSSVVEQPTKNASHVHYWIASVFVVASVVQGIIRADDLDPTMRIASGLGSAIALLIAPFVLPGLVLIFRSGRRIFWPSGFWITYGFLYLLMVATFWMDPATPS